MPCKNWDEEWLKNHSKKTIRETLDLYNKEHNTNKTYDGLKYKLRTMGIKKESPTGWDEEWLINNFYSMDKRKLQEEYNKVHGTNKTFKAIEAKVRRLGLYTRGEYIKWDDEWIIEHFENGLFNYNELRNEYNKVHDTNIQRCCFKQHMRSLDLFCGKRFFANDEDEFLKNFYSDTSPEKLEEMYVDMFGKERNSEHLMDRAIKKLGLHKSNEYNIKTPHRNKPIGYIYTPASMKDSRKIKLHDGNYCSYPKYLYEQKHGKIPDGYKIFHKDGNIRNDEIDNLVALNNEYLVLIYKSLGIKLQDKILTDCAIKWCDLYKLLKEKGKEKQYENIFRSSV